MIEKFCFLSEANYPNYTRRLKEFNLKQYLQMDLDIPFYISTNRPEDFIEYKDNPNIRVFDIEDLRQNNPESIINEPLPSDPRGLYPARYPWNTRRFIINKAIEDGYLGMFFLECDTKINDRVDKESLYSLMTSLYQPNTVKTSSARFVYAHRHPSQELFYNHQTYINDLGLNFKDEQYDTLDGTNQLFFGQDTDSLKTFMSNWNFIADYGYKKPYGYKTGYLSNLSFVIPMSGFKLIHTDTPFITEHKFDDRY
jgi:hypothetical protein